jgi:uncharacterized SAM-binding protein YcdF (DUF218 family)
VTSGGRSWDGVSTEADCFAQALLVRGVAPEHILRERCSMNTRDNARYSVTLLRRRGLSPRWVVTCDTHAARARQCFRETGVDVELVPAVSPRGPRTRITSSVEWLRARVRPLRGMVTP